MKKWLSGLLSAALCVCIAAGSAALAPSAAEEERADVSVDASASALTGETRAKNNINGNSYNRYNSVVRSYLRPTSDGFMRIYGSDDGTLLAEYYDSQYRFVSNRTVACGLPLFGGFYEYGGRYYVLTGDKNLNEDDSKEVFRITCFDKDWKPVGKDSLYGVNTYVPFEVGRASFAVCGSQLFIRSCHQIRSHINPPKTTTIHLVALVQVEVGFIRRLTEVTTIVTTLHHKLHLTVAINIGHRTIVQSITTDGSTIAIHDILHWNLQILMIPRLTLSSLSSLFHTFHYRNNLIGTGL